ncbi:glycosyl hydrolase family 61-domain-containing protein, partial [Bisporella sp. PMI_857]
SLTQTSTGESWLVWNKNRINVTIPKEVLAGQYPVRLEHLALHRPSGSEMYFNCAQIEVERDSTITPTAIVKIPGVYSANTKGLSPNIVFPVAKAVILYAVE